MKRNERCLLIRLNFATQNKCNQIIAQNTINNHVRISSIIYAHSHAPTSQIFNNRFPAIKGNIFPHYQLRNFSTHLHLPKKRSNSDNRLAVCPFALCLNIFAPFFCKSHFPFLAPESGLAHFIWSATANRDSHHRRFSRLLG